MVDLNAEQSRTSPLKTVGWLRWLINPERRGLLLPISGLWMFALDWLLFSSNALSLGLATPIMVAIGFVLGGAGTYLFQRRLAGDKSWKAALKSFVAGIAVGVPWPLVGTLAGGWILVASGLGKAKNEITRK